MPRQIPQRAGEQHGILCYAVSVVGHVSEYPWSSWSEYVSHTDGFCATTAVLSRIPREALAELVCSPVEEYGILDIDADTDKQVIRGWHPTAFKADWRIVWGNSKNMKYENDQWNRPRDQCKRIK